MAPARTIVPTTGSWYTTLDPGSRTSTTSTRKPSPVSSATARSFDIPTTSGISTVRGPFDTTIVTVSPGCSSVPLTGSWEITCPRGTSSENSSTTSTRNPAVVSVLVAWSWVRPTTFCTGTGLGPRLTTTSTELPWGASWSARTLWRTTWPAGNFSLYASVTSPGFSFASRRAAFASPSGRPTSGGTGTGGGPSEGVSGTRSPPRGGLPPGGG